MEQVQENEVMTPASRILTAYKDYLLNNGKRPASVYKFSADLGMKEEDFYAHFGSFTAVERAIWNNFIDSTVSKLKADDNFAQFSAREKILTFYYAFFEEIKSSRSFILLQLENQKKLQIVPDYLKDFRLRYQQFIEEVINTGKEDGEIARRPYLDKRYPSFFWLQMAFLLLFWRDDNSAGFERTDAAIEKSVNLSFDLIGKGAVDSVVDFAKFLYQARNQ